MFFFKKKTIELPIEFGNFPPYTGKIKNGPIRIDRPGYTRIVYYVKGGIDIYKNELINRGFIQKSDVRFERSGNDYIIIEPDFLKYKIAYHKKK